MPPKSVSITIAGKNRPTAVPAERTCVPNPVAGTPLAEVPAILGHLSLNTKGPEMGQIRDNSLRPSGLRPKGSNEAQGPIRGVNPRKTTMPKIADSTFLKPHRCSMVQQR